jgi:sugar phosphate isomerase/epimerase
MERPEGEQKMKRRTFNQITLAAAGMAVVSKTQAAQGNPIYLGGPVFAKTNDPQQWAKAVKELGYSAAYCPLRPHAGDDDVNAYQKAARENGIIIAEVGAWSNPISPNQEERENAFKKCVDSLELAERIGARCCVNISGSRGEEWAGHDPKNLTKETFDLVVETTRSIIDSVNPKRTYYSLETMPWAYPDSVDSYMDLIKAIDRKAFAAHFDPVNLICSPQRYYSIPEIIRDGFKKLGPYIKSCHAKDIIMPQKLTTHLDETRPGQGNLDYAVFLKELSKMKEIPLMLEHLPNAEEYREAADHIRKVGKDNGFTFA